MDGDPRKAAHEDLVEPVVVEDGVDREDHHVLNGGHDVCSARLVETENAVENEDLVVSKRLLAGLVELEEGPELGLLVRRVFVLDDPRRKGVKTGQEQRRTKAVRTAPRTESSSFAMGQAMGAKRYLRRE